MSTHLDVQKSLNLGIHMQRCMSSETLDKVRTTVTIARKVWKEAKIAAVREGITLARIVQKALEMYLEELEKREKEKKEETGKP